MFYITDRFYRLAYTLESAEEVLDVANSICKFNDVSNTELVNLQRAILETQPEYYFIYDLMKDLSELNLKPISQEALKLSIKYEKSNLVVFSDRYVLGLCEVYDQSYSTLKVTTLEHGTEVSTLTRMLNRKSQEVYM